MPNKECRKAYTYLSFVHSGRESKVVNWFSNRYLIKPYGCKYDELYISKSRGDNHKVWITTHYCVHISHVIPHIMTYEDPPIIRKAEKGGGGGQLKWRGESKERKKTKCQMRSVEKLTILEALSIRVESRKQSAGCYSVP